MNLSDIANNAKNQAGEVIARHKKLASFQLYGVLVPCLEILERCERDPNELIEMEKLFQSLEYNGNRHYVERHYTKKYLSNIICRYVFDGSNRTNIMRYSAAIRQARDKQISSGQLYNWLKTNGGINALYFARPLATRSIHTKTLRLRDGVRFNRDKELVLRLRWNTDNTFTVIQSNVAGD